MSQQQQEPEQEQDPEQDPVSVRLEPDDKGRLRLRFSIAEAEEGSSSLSSVFLLCNSAIGAGVLSLPLAFRYAGLLGCLLICVGVGLCEGFTLYVLSKFAERYDVKTYNALVRRALGKKLSVALSLILILYLWGSCIAYCIIVGDSFTPLAELLAGPGSAWADRRVVIAVLCLCIITPLSFPRNLSALAWVSMAAVIGFVYTAIVVVVQGARIVWDRHDLSDVRLFRWEFDALTALPICVFGFNCHANVVSVFTCACLASVPWPAQICWRELGAQPQRLLPGLPEAPSGFAALPSALAPRPRTRKMVGMLSIILACVTIIMTGYLLVGIVGYLAFPTSVGGNVLNSFTAGAPIIEVARGVVGAVVIVHCPINLHPARTAVEHLEHTLFGWKTISVAFSTCQTLASILSILAVALVVTDLGVVLQLIGGTAAAFMIFFLPGLLLINGAIVKDDYLKEQLDLSQRGGAVVEALRTGSGDLQSPLLARPYEQGLKRVGLIYSRRKSWWAGCACCLLSVAIFVVTLVTAFA